ncbi:hypothetical protein EVAR_67603_1 [Eumeta japonica]|uniref:Uncharacterized protein n=1 Tax=Eumeta variegata TaxID=151549 RepID=A0A4C1ZLN0_EUMVA|nr:hypothetical protein EVAR_67603_1 [Eumeta japonica]
MSAVRKTPAGDNGHARDVSRECTRAVDRPYQITRQHQRLGLQIGFRGKTVLGFSCRYIPSNNSGPGRAANHYRFYKRQHFGVSYIRRLKLNFGSLDVTTIRVWE